MSGVSALFRDWFKPLVVGFILVTTACSSRNATPDAKSPETLESVADQPGGMRSSIDGEARRLPGGIQERS